MNRAYRSCPPLTLVLGDVAAEAPTDLTVKQIATPLSRRRRPFPRFQPAESARARSAVSIAHASLADADLASDISDVQLAGSDLRGARRDLAVVLRAISRTPISRMRSLRRLDTSSALQPQAGERRIFTGPIFPAPRYCPAQTAPNLRGRKAGRARSASTSGRRRRRI